MNKKNLRDLFFLVLGIIVVLLYNFNQPLGKKLVEVVDTMKVNDTITFIKQQENELKVITSK